MRCIWLSFMVCVTHELDSKIRAEWTGWPDGDWEYTFTEDELKRFPGLTPNHWACTTSGSSVGDANASQWFHGRKSERRCQGAIVCEKHPYCSYILCPKVKKANKQKQLQARCLCGASLRRTQPQCRAKQQLWHFRGGIHFIHTSSHNHPRLTHILHLSKDEKTQFEKIVSEHPAAGPLELLIGPKTLHGPGQSVAEISPAFLNKDRIKSERRAVTSQAVGFSGGDSFISSFREFCERHPGFVISSHIHEVTVISMQTPTMIPQLVKDSSSVEGSVNGIVSDAAHGFWRERTSLLLVSSSYSVDLHAWIPALLSYSNGATHEHFRLHFLALFRSIALEKQHRGLEFTDEDFSNVHLYPCLQTH